MKRFDRFVLLAAIAIASGGCASNYVTPAGGVSMPELTDADLQSFYESEPVSPFPANIAILRELGACRLADLRTHSPTWKR